MLASGGLWLDSKNGDAKVYQNNIKATAEFIKKQITEQTTSSDYVLIEYPTTININPESARTDTATTLFPNGKWRIIHDYKYFENNLGQSSLDGIYTSDFTTTFDKPGKYEIDVGNDNEVLFKKLKLVSQNDAKFTEENGKYYVTFSYLALEGGYVEVNSYHEIDTWHGYVDEDYSFSNIENYKTN